MIYLDTSVALAHLLAEERRPQADLWEQAVISSRLLEYEIWVRLNQLSLTRAQEEIGRALLNRIALIEMIPEILARAREEFPVAVRSLDALHLASAAFLIKEGLELQLATYDERMRAAARKLKIPVYSGL
jgi:predicted nucleic acid-binding protein